MIQDKILSPAKLLSELKKVRKKKSKLVFTNGCFDLLHPGHVLYLEKARALGSVLIVALNSDESVKRLKGPTRPLTTLTDRAKVVAALESVTYVTWFSEDTPLNLIKKIIPNVLAKGGDYVAKEVVGYAEVTAAGGAVKIIPFVKNQSTTGIVQKISSNY